MMEFDAEEMEKWEKSMEMVEVQIGCLPFAFHANALPGVLTVRE